MIHFSSEIISASDIEKEMFFLFNDVLNTFYLQLYGVRHMVKDHSDSEKGNPQPPHRLLLSINSKGSFISHRQDNTYHGLCYTGALAGMRNISMGPPHEGSIRRPIARMRHRFKNIPSGSLMRIDLTLTTYQTFYTIVSEY